MTTYTERARRFLALTTEREELEAKLSKVKAQLGHLEEGLLDDIANHEAPSRAHFDGRTIYVRRDTYANVPAGEDGHQGNVAILRAHGLDFLIKTAPVPATVRAWVIEREKAAREAGAELVLPDDLAAIIRIEHRFSIRTTKGTV